jgi:ADP-ribosylglycohydrolase
MTETAEGLLAFAREELRQLSEEGCDTWELERRADLVQREGGPDQLKRARALCEALARLRPPDDFPYQEPDDLSEIRARRPDGPRRIAVPLTDDVLDDRTRGAWLGRAAGCMLGKPVEGWSRERIADLMDAVGIKDLTDYLPAEASGPGGLLVPEGHGGALRGNFNRALRDDDMDYSVVGLCILERHGREFTPRQVADFWLHHLPYACTYTAERAAYANFIAGVWPPESATHRNPYREWIGAQIRADAFGYACPGRPEDAAGLAYKDASISHVKNGIYGEMWAAAMLAAAFVTDVPAKVIAFGLSEIPARCRLSEAINKVLAWRADGLTAEDATERLLEEFGRYHRVHTINNAAIVAMALLWGEGDFSRAVSLAVMAGLDTDCNGATVGSVMGAMLGAAAIPEHWTASFNDRLDTIIAGQASLTFTGLTERTRKVQQTMKTGR